MIGFYSRDWFRKNSINEEISFQQPDIHLKNVAEYHAIFPDTSGIQQKQKECILQQGADEFGPV